MIHFDEYYNLHTEALKFPITHSSAKQDIVKWENALFKRAYPTPRNGGLYGVVGRVDQGGLENHIKQYKDLGYDMSQIFLFEIDEQMFKPLYRKSVQLYGRKWTDHHVERGDLLQYINQYPEANVTHVDFDVTQSVRDSLAMKIPQKILGMKSVQTCTIVGSGRAPFAQEDFSGLNIFDDITVPQVIAAGMHPQTLHNARGVLIYIINGATRPQLFYMELKEKFSNVAIQYQSYIGANNSTMFSFVFAKDTAQEIWGEPPDANIPPQNVSSFKRVLKLKRNILLKNMQKGNRRGVREYNEVLKRIKQSSIQQQIYHNMSDELSAL